MACPRVSGSLPTTRWLKHQAVGEQSLHSCEAGEALGVEPMWTTWICGQALPWMELVWTPV